MQLSLLEVVDHSSRLLLVLLLLSLCASSRTAKPSRNASNAAASTHTSLVLVPASTLAAVCAAVAPLLIDSSYAFAGAVKDAQPLQQAFNTYAASFNSVGTKPSFSALLHKIAVAMAANDAAAGLFLLVVGCSVAAHLLLSAVMARKRLHVGDDEGRRAISSVAVLHLATAAMLARDYMTGSISSPWLLHLCTQAALVLSVWHGTQHGVGEVTATLACLHALLKLAAVGIEFSATVEKPDWGMVAATAVTLLLPMLGRSQQQRTFQRAWGAAVVITAVALGAMAKCEEDSLAMRKINAGCMLAQAIAGICTLFMTGMFGITISAVVIGGLCTAFHVQIQGLSGFQH